MDLNRISYFVSIVESGSYTQAAHKLGIPKSTLSRHIQALEQDMQIRLLNRSTRTLSLTKAGEIFYQKSQSLVNSLQNVHHQMSEYHQDVMGSLRITMPYEFGSLFLHGVLPTFVERYPKIKLDIDFSTENQNLIEKRFDLAIRLGELEDSSYICRRITTANISLYATPSYLKKSGKLKSLEDLYQHKNIVMSQSKGILPLANGDFFQREDNQIRTTSISFNKTLCLSGMGITVLPDLLCQEELKTGTLVKCLTQYPLASTDINAVYPSRQHPSKALTTFIDFIIQEKTNMELT